MEDWQGIATGTGVGGLVLIIVGRWVVPLLKKMFENMAISLDAGGGAIVKTQADRDYWHKAYDNLFLEMKELRTGWVDMKTKYDLLEYKFTQSENRHTECEMRYQEISDRLSRANERIRHLENP